MSPPTPPSTGDDAARRETPTGEAAWSAAAAAVLRKMGRLSADAPDSAAWDRLARTTVEGLTIPPLGTAARDAALRTATGMHTMPGRAPFLRGAIAPGDADAAWDIRALLADPDPVSANRSALADLEGGATSLWIRIRDGGPEPADLATVLDGVVLGMAPVVLHAPHPDDTAAAARALADLAGRSGPLHPDSNLGADPIGQAARAGLAGQGVARSAASRGAALDRPMFRGLPEMTALATDLGIRAIVVDGTVAHDAGAGDSQEIGYTLAAGAAYLRALTAAGIPVDAACGLIEFRYAATDDQFATIAKLRAARFAWHRVAELSGVAPAARAQRQHAVTSPAMLTRYDPWVNLLRTTVAAFASGVGGAGAVTVLPFDGALGVPEEFGRRMARNISALLLDESHVAAAVDPAGGAHAVETLTAGLADAAWAEFGRIEASGAILGALADGSLAQRVAATRAERDRRIATRRQPITGVSEFPLAGELPPARAGSPLTAGVTRWAEPFERLRDAPVADPVLLVTVGGVADAATRRLFAENLLTAGGLAISLDPGGEIDGRTVVLVGSDAAYADHGAAVIADLRSRGVARVFLAGRPPESLAGLLDGRVAAGDDVLDVLAVLRNDEEVRS